MPQNSVQIPQLYNIIAVSLDCCSLASYRRVGSSTLHRSPPAMAPRTKDFVGLVPPTQGRPKGEFDSPYGGVNVNQSFSGRTLVLTLTYSL